MSLIKANAVQIGQSPTATQNFTLAVPSSPDGTIKLARGNSGATTQDVLSVDASGNVSFAGTTALGNISNSTAIATGSTTARSLANRFSDVVSVLDFGAFNNGTNAAATTTAIQAAIDSIGSKGGLVYFPAGTYLVSSTITISKNKTYLQGQGNNSIITRNTDYGNTFVFTGNTTTGLNLFDVGISDIQITSTALTTSGAHIKADGVWRMTIDNIYIQDGFIGFDFGGLVASNISNIYLVFTSLYSGSTTGRKYMTFKNASSAFAKKSSGDVFVNNFNLRGNTSNQITEIGLEIISADGIWFENGHIGNTTYSNILLNASTTEMLNLVFFSNVMSDEGITNSLTFDGNVPSVNNLIEFSNCTFKSGGIPSFCDYGIIFLANSTVTNVKFTGCTVTEFGKTGVTTSGANHTNIYFSNCNVFTNGSDTTATFPGYNLLSGSRFISIVGGRSSGVDQSYAIQLGGSHTNIIIDSVDLTGNATDSINGFQSGIIVSNCNIQGNINVASASTITPPLGENIQYVTGTTNINNISASNVGRIIVLNFQGILTVNDGVGNIKLNGNFTTSVDDTLTLVYNGAEWVEIARSTN
jgi:hypothetical protein